MILNDNRINKVNIFLNLFLCLISVLFIALGVLGEYISKIYDEVKGTSPYIVSDTLNF